MYHVSWIIGSSLHFTSLINLEFHQEGMGWRDKGGRATRNNSATLQQIPGSPSRDSKWQNNAFAMDCSPPGSSIHGIFQARVLEWVAVAFSVTNLGSVLKSRDITSPTKVYIVKAMVFPVVVYMESWTIKKPKCNKKQKLMLLNCGTGEDSWESLGQQGD